MIHDLYWIYGCNIVINSALSFATTLILVLMGLFIFRVKDPRIKSMVMTIPLFKLVIDLFLYNFSDWALLHEINPVEAEPGSRTLMMWLHLPLPATTGIQLLTSEGRTFTLADLMTLSIHPGWVKAAFAVVAVVTVCFLGVWSLRFQKSFKLYRTLIYTARPCRKPIFNPLLNYKLNRARIAIVTSQDISVPCALGVFRKYIVFPETLLKELSQTEFEAVVAHEYDHLRWYDSIVRLGSSLLGSVFWWIPMRRCIAYIERLQEYACDRKVVEKGVDPADLAAAICKAAKFAKQPGTPCLCACFVDKYTVSYRIKRLLAEPAKNRMKVLRWMQNLAVAVLMTVILLGKFWIF